MRVRTTLVGASDPEFANLGRRRLFRQWCLVDQRSIADRGARWSDGTTSVRSCRTSERSTRALVWRPVILHCLFHLHRLLHLLQHCLLHHQLHLHHLFRRLWKKKLRSIKAEAGGRSRDSPARVRSRHSASLAPSAPSAASSSASVSFVPAAASSWPALQTHPVQVARRIRDLAFRVVGLAADMGDLRHESVGIAKAKEEGKTHVRSIRCDHLVHEGVLSPSRSSVQAETVPDDSPSHLPIRPLDHFLKDSLHYAGRPVLPSQRPYRHPASPSVHSVLFDVQVFSFCFPPLHGDRARTHASHPGIPASGSAASRAGFPLSESARLLLVALLAVRLWCPTQWLVLSRTAMA